MYIYITYVLAYVRTYMLCVYMLYVICYTLYVRCYTYMCVCVYLSLSLSLYIYIYTIIYTRIGIHTYHYTSGWRPRHILDTFTWTQENLYSSIHRRRQALPGFCSRISDPTWKPKQPITPYLNHSVMHMVHVDGVAPGWGSRISEAEQGSGRGYSIV